MHSNDSDSHDIGDCSDKRDYLKFKNKTNASEDYYNSSFQSLIWDYTYTVDEVTNVISFTSIDGGLNPTVLEITSNVLKLDEGEGYYYELRRAK